MNKKLKQILDIIQQSEKLDGDQKNDLLKSVKDVDKEFEITAFKLERTEKVKKTTAILLEETIEELEQKRKAVEAQNRELEIEASLERVRAVAMSMNKSDDLLSICEVSFHEFKKLGFDNLRNSIIHILNDEKGFFLDYDYSDHLGGSINKINYDSHPIVENYLKQIKKADDAFAEVIVEGSELEGWKDFRRKGGQQDDPKLDNIPALYYYLYSIGVGDIGISTINPIDGSQINILKRFRNVFDLAYRRYTDITEAEAQAREAQIEAAMERVRAKAMAMHSTKDISDATAIVFNELTGLGVNMERCGIAILHDKSSRLEIWSTPMSPKDKKVKEVITGYLASNFHPMIQSTFKAWKNNESYFTYTLQGKEVRDYYEKLGKVPGYRFPKIAKYPDRQMIHCFYFEHGNIFVYSKEDLSEEQKQLLHRFTKVFSLTYKRYLDLKNAEAQVREAQIEAALERVRSKTMAMHKSEELSETAKVFFEQMHALGELPDRIGINIIKEDEKLFEIWATNQDGSSLDHRFRATIEEPTSYSKLYAAWKAKKDYIIIDLKGQELKKWIKFVREEIKMTVDDKNIKGRRIHNAALFSNGVLLCTTHEPVKDEVIKLLVRFAKVFDQTYRRFLDLQKAEVQAREAQIEAALERVRSRTMGMQKSEELKEVIQLVYKQFVQLNIYIEHTGFIMDYNARDDMHIWLADRHEVPSEVTIPYFDCAHWNSFNDAKEKGIDFFANHLTLEEKNKFYQDLFKLIPGVPEETLEYYFGCPGLAISTVLLENVGLYIENFSGIPYSDEENNTLMRFGKVFQQTYTRFNDLKQAETQARESQIQLALEKVRLVALGLKKSMEMLEVAKVLYEQLLELGFSQIRNAIIDIKNGNDDTFTDYDYSHEMAGTITQMSYHDDPTLKGQFKKMATTTDDFFELVLEGKELEDLIAMRLKNGEAVDSRLLNIDLLTYNLYSFGNGAIGISNFGVLSVEEKSILNRFSNVFTFAYKRYNDLASAEKQAREAQIEAALERVRSKTMAMHKSYELAETASVLFEQFATIGIVPKRCSISIINSADETANFWMTSSEGKVIRGANTVPMHEQQNLIDLYTTWKSKKKHHYFVLNGEARAEWTDYLMNKIKIYIPEYQPETINQSELLSEPAVFNCFFFAQGFIMLHTVEDLAQEDIPTLERFAGVFEQTYTRFLDLKKAEAQAREAQIEAALERVRSKTMAMHNSQDVGDTVVTLFDEVLKLGLDKSIRCGIGILEGNEGMETWSATSTPDGEVDLKMGMLDMTIHPMLTGLKKSWESGKTFYSYDYIGDDVIRYYTALNNEPEYPFHIDLDTLPENEYHNSFFFTEGILFAFAPNPISDEAAKVLDRFARVFGQTYRRYRDLLKAEAQVREAQIEASLERVRSKAMAMHSSEDLSATVNVFFKELKTLGIAPIRCGVGQIDEETRTTSLTTTTSSQQGDSFEVIGKIKQTGHPVLDGIYEHWELQKEYHPVLQGDDIKAYYSVMKPQMAFPDYPEDATQYGNLFYFKEGFVFAWTESKLIEDELQIFRRFTSVLSLTYRRYMDLKETEARAREAEQQASLDRVRAEIASMHTTDDLEKITPLVWRELTTLGLPFFRCGIFIIDESEMTAHGYLATPSGKSLGTLHLKIDEGYWIDEAVKHWQRGKVYNGQWSREQFIEWTQTMMNQGFVENREEFQDGKEAPEKLYLQLLPFTQGMLYVGTRSPLSKEDIELAQKLADAFGVAYVRFEDFQKLEAANHRKSLELEEARQLQLSMLPKELPQLPNLNIAVYMKTATEVGGDYYDFNVGADGTLTVAIGDATGHGMKAGTIVSMIKALFASGGSKMDMKTYFKQSSDALKGIELGRLMMAFLMLRINSNKLHFANAAMPPVYIYKNQSKDVEEIMISGMPLGAMRNFPYEIKELDISSGDTILLLSDGLPELKNGKDEHYGYDRVKDNFKSVAEKSPDDIVEYLKNTASKWINGVEPDDDVTFVVIKVK